MRQGFKWFGKTGIFSTFLAGLFALLPVAIPVCIMAWAGGLLQRDPTVKLQGKKVIA